MVLLVVRNQWNIAAHHRSSKRPKDQDHPMHQMNAPGALLQFLTTSPEDQ